MSVPPITEESIDKVINMPDEEVNKMVDGVTKVMEDIFGNLPEGFSDYFSQMMKTGQQTMRENEDKLREKIQAEGGSIENPMQVDPDTKEAIDMLENDEEGAKEKARKALFNAFGQEENDNSKE